jgi:hypothetical protein
VRLSGPIGVDNLEIFGIFLNDFIFPSLAFSSGVSS